MSAPFKGQDLAVVGGTSADVYRERGTLETLSNTISLSAKDMETASLMRLMNLSTLDPDGERLPPEQLRDKFPEHRDLFNYEMSEIQAQEVIKEANSRRNLEMEIAKGPQGVVQTGLNFAAGMIPHALDPIGWGVGMATGGILKASSFGAKMYKAISAMKEAGNVRKAAAAGLSLQMAENAVGNLLVEPIPMTVANLEGREYGAAEAFTNAVGGAILGTAVIRGIGGGVKFAWNKINPQAGKVGSKSPAAVELTLDMVTNQLKAGRRPDVSRVIRDMVQETAPSREFKRINPADVASGKVYAPKNKRSKPALGNARAIGDNYGDNAIYLSFDEGSANGAAASKYSDRLGAVEEFEISEKMNLLDLDEPAPSNFRSIAEEFSPTVAARGADATVSSRQLLEDVKTDIREGKLEPEALDQLNARMAEEGYDGYYHDNRVELGEEGNRNNVMVLFNDSKLKSNGVRAGDRSRLKLPTQEELVEMNRAESTRDDSPFELRQEDLDPTSRQIVEREFEPDDVETKVDKDYEDLLARAEEEHRAGILTDEQLKAVRDSNVNPTQLMDIMKAGTDCLINGALNV